MEIEKTSAKNNKKVVKISKTDTLIDQFVEKINGEIDGIVPKKKISKSDLVEYFVSKSTDEDVENLKKSRLSASEIFQINYIKSGKKEAGVSEEDYMKELFIK